MHVHVCTQFSPMDLSAFAMLISCLIFYFLDPLGAGAIIGIAIGSAVGGTIIIMIICCLLMIILFCIIYSNRCRNCWRRKSSKTTGITFVQCFLVCYY